MTATPEPTPSPPPRPTSWWGPVRALFIAVGVLVILDLVLGLVAAPEGNMLYDADPSLFWRMRPHVANFEQRSMERANEETITHISTNALGIRDDELPAKASGEMRVLCVGDSSIFGHGVEIDATFERQLQARLRKAAPGRDIRVVNGGVSGYSSFQGRQFFHELAPKVKPDVVVIAYYFSDFIPDVMEDRRRVPPGAASSSMMRALARSNIYQFIRDEMEKHARQEAQSTQGQSLVARVAAGDYPDNLNAMIDEAQGMGAKVVLLLLDPRVTPLPDGQKPYREAMAQVAAARKIPLVDMHGPFAAYSGDRTTLFVDEVHPSSTGNGLIAEALFAAMQGAGMVPSSAATPSAAPASGTPSP